MRLGKNKKAKKSNFFFILICLILQQQQQKIIIADVHVPTCMNANTFIYGVRTGAELNVKTAYIKIKQIINEE